MLGKKMFKVISPIEHKDGTTHWMRVGSGFPNKDASINIYLDAVPKDLKFQLREMTEEDFRTSESRRNARNGTSGEAPPSQASSANEPLPF